MTQRDWQKDMEIQIKMKNCAQKSGFKTEEEDAAIYWMIQAKERGEREQQLIEAIKKAQERFKHGDVIMALIEGSMILTDALSSLYPDTPAPTKEDNHD